MESAGSGPSNISWNNHQLGSLLEQTLDRLCSKESQHILNCQKRNLHGCPGQVKEVLEVTDTR